MVIYICIKFQENISNSFEVTEGHKYITEITIFKSSKGIIPKVGKPELPFLCSAPCLMMLYICVKFHQNIWNGFQLTEQTQVHSRNGYFQYLLCSTGRNSKSRVTWVTYFVFCMLFHGPGSWCYTFVRSCIKISWMVFNLQSGHEYIVQMGMFNHQRAITQKVGKPELQFMCFVCRSWCFIFVWSFLKISGTVFNLQSGHEYMVEMAMFNVQRAKLQK